MKVLTLKKDSSKGFLYLTGINRPIAPGQVTKLAKSILKMGCIRPIVVAKIDFLDGTSGIYIIDGQHLFNALIRCNMDIPYVMVNITNKQELVENIALLNASSKSWQMIDYVTSWSCISDDYKKLMHYFNVYDMDFRVLASVLSGNPTVSSQISTDVKRGTFHIKNEKQAIVVLDNLTDVLKIAPRRNRFENRYLCIEYCTFLLSQGKCYNHKVFISKLDKNKDKLILSTQESGKLIEIFEKL